MHQYLDVRIVKLEPMRVASLTGYGETPELAAWSTLLQWARDRELLENEPPPRFFGQDVEPLPNSLDDHAYEIWMTVGDNIWSDHIVHVKDVPGGLYAVTRVTGIENIFPTWQRLDKWVEESIYRVAKRPGLEEFPQFVHLLTEPLVLDLYLPIEE